MNFKEGTYVKVFRGHFGVLVEVKVILLGQIKVKTEVCHYYFGTLRNRACFSEVLGLLLLYKVLFAYVLGQG